MKIPKAHLSPELLHQLREKKVVRQDGYTFRDLDDEYVEVVAVRTYSKAEGQPDAYARWVIHGW
jgi:hypothetical protein